MEGLSGYNVVEGLPLDNFHDEIYGVLSFVDLVKSGDVFMGKAAKYVYFINQQVIKKINQ